MTEDRKIAALLGSLPCRRFALTQHRSPGLVVSSLGIDPKQEHRHMHGKRIDRTAEELGQGLMVRP